MQPIGRINSYRAALAFKDFLQSQGIDSALERSDDYTTILVAHPLDVDPAMRELQRFFAEPDHPRYRVASWTSGDTRESAYSTGNTGKGGLKNFLSRGGLVTLVTCLLATIVTLVTGFGTNELVFALTFNASAILTGEVYRLITPIFLHFPILGIPFLHLLFNLMWIWDLGGQLEKRLGSSLSIYHIITIGLLSNTAQYLVAPQIIFGGLSGVVFGLLGYFWLRGEIDPRFGLRVNKSLLMFLLIWMALGFVGVIPGMADTAHLAGFLSGIALAWLDVKVFKFRRYR